MPIKGRKGIEQQTVYILLGLVILITLVTLIPRIANQIQTTTDQSSCRASVEALQKLHIGGNQVSPDEVSCPTQEITIRSDNVGIMKKKMADAMAKCWRDFKRGKPTVFSKSRMYCALCSVIDFSHEGKEFGHFTEFLATEPLPSDNSITYLDYLMRYETPKAQELINDPDVFNKADSALDGRFNTSREYAVIFVYAKGKETIEDVIDYFGRKKTSTAMGFGAFGLTTLATAGTAIALGSNPIGWVTATLTGFGILVGSATGITTYISDKDDQAHLAFIMLQEHTPNTFKELGCEYYPASQENYKYEEG